MTLVAHNDTCIPILGALHSSTRSQLLAVYLLVTRAVECSSCVGLSRASSARHLHFESSIVGATMANMPSSFFALCSRRQTLAWITLGALFVVERRCEDEVRLGKPRKARSEALKSRRSPGSTRAYWPHMQPQPSLGISVSRLHVLQDQWRLCETSIIQG